MIQSIESIINKDRRVNKEFYLDVALDECISLGFNVMPFEVNDKVSFKFDASHRISRRLQMATIRSSEVKEARRFHDTYDTPDAVA